MDFKKKVNSSSRVLAKELRLWIDTARSQVAQAINASLVLLYWRIGERIRTEILRSRRGPYGAKIVPTLSALLEPEYGRGFSARNLFKMIRFAECFPDPEVIKSLSSQLSWSHFIEIIPLKDSLRRDFYAEMCRLERWNVRTLRIKIGGMLFERTGLAKRPAQVVQKELQALKEHDQLTPELVFRDPSFLDFLNLGDAYSEKDLEFAILRELEHFLLELGTDFTFVARQKRMHLGHKDYHLDLLFFHRRLRALVAVELKLSRFEPSDMGQMKFYLRWLDQFEKRPGENAPLGLILCASKHHEMSSWYV